MKPTKRVTPLLFFLFIALQLPLLKAQTSHTSCFTQGILPDSVSCQSSWKERKVVRWKKISPSTKKKIITVYTPDGKIKRDETATYTTGSPITEFQLKTYYLNERYITLEKGNLDNQETQSNYSVTCLDADLNIVFKNKPCLSKAPKFSRNFYRWVERKASAIPFEGNQRFFVHFSISPEQKIHVLQLNKKPLSSHWVPLVIEQQLIDLVLSIPENIRPKTLNTIGKEKVTAYFTLPIRFVTN